MEFLLIRHLPTEWNRKGILQGSKDIPILPIIETDAIKIRENLKVIYDFKPDLILASQLIRTQQTAAEYGFKDPIIDPLLNELNFGDFEGIKKEYLLEKKQWINNPRTMQLGECMIDFEERIFQFLHQFQQDSRLLIFGHGSWIRGLLSISKIGTIQKMNQVKVKNNQLIHLENKKQKKENTKGGGISAHV